MSLMKSLGIDRWSVEERQRLLDEISLSIELEDEASPLGEDLERELARRLEAHETDPTDVVPWDVVKAEALARFRK